LWTIAVTYGFAPHTLEEEDPDVLVDSPEELSTIFLSQRSLQEQK
jgi:phosphoglycolate phosphatase-like HAD superfamily hydrolase